MRNSFTAAALAAVMGIAVPALAQTTSDAMKPADTMKPAMTAKPMDTMDHDKMAMKPRKAMKHDHMTADDKMKPADGMGH